MDGMMVIKSIMQESAMLKAQGKDIVSLGVGVPYYGMPREMKEYCADLLLNSKVIDEYTPFAGLPKLRDRIAEMLSAEMKRDVTKENVLITAGSMAGLYYVFKALLVEDDSLLVPSPYFLSYRDQVDLVGGLLGAHIWEEPMECVGDHLLSWRLNLENIEAAFYRDINIQAILINSPHNPTGVVFNKNELLKLAELAVKYRQYVITDEAYSFLNYKDNAFNIATIAELQGRVIRCGSFSKQFGMTGWRVGYIYAEGEVMQKIMKVHDNISVCAPHLGQEAVWYGLTHDIPEMAANLQGMEENRRVLLRILNSMKEYFSYAPAEGAFYVMAKYSLEMSSLEFAQRLLREVGVVVIPGEIFGQGGEGFVRLSFGGKREEIVEAMKRIEGWVRSNK